MAEAVRGRRRVDGERERLSRASRPRLACGTDWPTKLDKMESLRVALQVGHIASGETMDAARFVIAFSSEARVDAERRQVLETVAKWIQVDRPRFGSLAPKIVTASTPDAGISELVRVPVALVHLQSTD